MESPIFHFNQLVKFLNELTFYSHLIIKQRLFIQHNTNVSASQAVGLSRQPSADWEADLLIVQATLTCLLYFMKYLIILSLSFYHLH